jgi:serine/threonine protein kinase
VLQKQRLSEAKLENNSLLREIELQKRLDHPNIVKVFEFYEDA